MLSGYYAQPEDPCMQIVKLTADLSIPHRAPHLQVRKGMRQRASNVNPPHSGRVKP